jgi:ubiquinone/menaquinone biosynthesis C-methylase UbiE
MHPPATAGLVMRSHARWYDALVWVLTLGRERALRERILALAPPDAGDAVLDVGCGTGTLAIAAARRVGSSGRVCGIDPSPEMIGRATAKAQKAGVAVDFRLAVVEALPFPDGSFDLVLSTLMLHHLPRATREAAMRESRRVLKPGGRLLAVDFGRGDAAERRGLIAHFHRHGGLRLEDVAATVEGAGLRVTGRGAMGTGNLQFVVATAP